MNGANVEPPARPSFGSDDTSKRGELRRLLADHQWHDQAEMLRAGGLRYNARLGELRRWELFDVVCERLAQGVYRYQLRGTLDQVPPTRTSWRLRARLAEETLGDARVAIARSIVADLPVLDVPDGVDAGRWFAQVLELAGDISAADVETTFVGALRAREIRVRLERAASAVAAAAAMGDR